MTRRCSVPLLLLGLLTAAPPAATDEEPAPPLRIVPILETGDPAPGIERSSVRLLLNAPAVNARGDLGLTASVATADEPIARQHAFLLEPSRDSVLLLAEQDPVPGFEGDRVGQSGCPLVGPDGAALLGIPVLREEDVVQWRRQVFVLVLPDGRRETFARVGALVPGVPAIFDELGEACLGEGGRFTFRAVLRDANGLTAAYFRGDPAGGLRLLAREGGPAPGLAGLSVESLPIRPPAISPGGVVAFSVRIPDLERGSADAVYRAAFDEEPSLLIRTGEPAGIGDAVVGRVTGVGLGGDASVFIAVDFERRPDAAIFVASPGGRPRPVAHVTTEEPEAGDGALPRLPANGIREILRSDGGRLVASVFVPSEDEEDLRFALLALEPDGHSRRLFGEGDPAPGLPGRRFSGDPLRFFVSASGAVAFVAGFDEKEEGFDRCGLWLAGPDGDTRLVAAVGQPFVVRGIRRIVKSVDVAGNDILPASNGSDGRPCPLSPAGQLFFRLGFTDRSACLYAASVAPPVVPASEAR